MTTQPGDGVSPPGLQLHLVDSDDEPLDEGEGGARRPSTASLSRFRSCPQLSSADTHGQESPSSDDHGLGPELCVGGAHFTHGSPRPRLRLHNKDDPVGGARSQTPTPPSTPGSRRSHTSIKDAASGGGGGGAAKGTDSSTAVAVNKAVGRTRREHALLGRTCSTDNAAFLPSSSQHEDGHWRSDDHSGSRLMSEFMDEPPEVSIDGRLTATEDGASTPLGGGGGGERGGFHHPHHHTDQDSMDKCARWLQSLKMTSGDRLKSRSQIQLPPI
ncbi:uncharacterized protein LOC143293424 [Babylonia areolata]|uniref:uncharacterized protein LOC143293424 n=1 Tax=Babylonia areolata TaxID=304850 RepID=UPI003FD514F6